MPSTLKDTLLPRIAANNLAIYISSPDFSLQIRLIYPIAYLASVIGYLTDMSKFIYLKLDSVPSSSLTLLQTKQKQKNKSKSKNKPNPKQNKTKQRPTYSTLDSPWTPLSLKTLFQLIMKSLWVSFKIYPDFHFLSLPLLCPLGPSHDHHFSAD